MCVIFTTVESHYVTILRYVLKFLQNSFLHNLRHTEYDFMLGGECEYFYYLQIHKLQTNEK